MGTVSKQGWNDRCTKRGPVSGQALYEAWQVLDNQRAHNRHERRRARAVIRKQAKFVRKRVPSDQRNAVQRWVVAAGAYL